MQTIEVEGSEFGIRNGIAFNFSVHCENGDGGWDQAFFTKFEDAREFMRAASADGVLCYCTQAMVMDTYDVLHSDKNAGSIRKV